MNKVMLILVSLGFMGTAVATSDNIAPQKPEYSQVQQQFSRLNLEVKAISESPVSGLLQVFTDKGLFFTSDDGQFFINGKIFDLHNQQLVNDNLMQPFIKQQLASISDQGIMYKADNEKYVIDVFTDPSCGYCRKLHNDITAYNRAGISVRYLAFPRGGEESATFLQMQHIWCSKDSKGAMDAAKSGDKVAATMCSNSVKQQYEMGTSFGISGTPAVILPSGRLIPGYQPLKQLLAQLEQG
ncbi:bifunctional protein-disulfide isomerase/oxidoreductase DsbC [Rheinheimera sp. WS51]|uniref:bifunctional protein-disulfide isomerase/oxidoreductase DsbC n=1 Tax=Rheinheimera sp. WS51 TaxID=3425886 RepID=UPI003D8B2CEF